jgi:AcrR family transcriptional regulator
MARPSVPSKPPPRRRRTAKEARDAILDAAERRLVAAGPAGIRIQEVAADAGLSHPTVLHHFGSREGLVEAVVARALDSLHEGLLAAVAAAPEGPDKVAELLDRVFDTLVSGGHARALLWLALEGYGGATIEQLRVRSLAVAVHDLRCALHKERNGKGSRKRLPTFEDTYFTILLPALALLSMSVMDRTAGAGRPVDPAAECGPARFRDWLARRVHAHLEGG